MSEKKQAGSKVKLAGLILAVIAIVVLFKIFSIQVLLKNALDWIAGQGILGAGIFVLLYILAAVLMIPGSVLTLGAGVIYGVVGGSILVSIAATLAATAAFLAGRYFARGWVVKRIEGNEKFKAIDLAVAKEGWKIVGLTRLSPIFPFNLLNYAYGVTKVSLKDYFFASWIGMIPGTIMYVYIGSLAGDLTRLGTEGRTKTMSEWFLYIVGLLATVAVTVYVTQIAKKALEKKV
ncbi:MAG: TVP38/TMEM64 family protein [Elusimicrobia bacterium]|nr:TVP38/TMEM64 family protein [Elusimicrobiota bacterium]